MKNPDWPFATVFPEFIARVGNSLRQGRCQGGKRQGGCGPQRSEDTALSRLDSARERATVADKVMRSGETVNRHWPVLTCQRHVSVSAQARIEESGRRRQG